MDKIKRETSVEIYIVKHKRNKSKGRKNLHLRTRMRAK